MYPVGKMSERNSTCSSSSPDSILIGPTSACGTRRYSACPPAKPPSMCENPNSPAGECPITLRAISALGLVVSHAENSVRSQKKHDPHAITNGTTTRSPFFNFVTPLPTSTTTPIGSCPRMSPASIVG
jgi:hypothetical protein